MKLEGYTNEQTVRAAEKQLVSLLDTMTLDELKQLDYKVKFDEIVEVIKSGSGV